MQPVVEFLKSLTAIRYDYGDAFKRQRARSLVTMTWGLTIGVFVGTLLMLFGGRVVRPLLYIGSFPLGASRLTYLIICVLCVLALVVVRRLLNRGRLHAANVMYIGLLYGIALLAYVPTELVGPIIAAFSMPVVAAGVLLDRSRLRIVTALVSATLLLLLILEQNGALEWIESGFPTPPIMAVGYNVIILAIDTVMLAVFAGDQRIQLEQRQALATELQRSVATVMAAQRSYQLLGEASQVIVHAANETELMQNICTRIVEIGGYRIAWAGLAEQGAVRVVDQVINRPGTAPDPFEPMASQHRSAVIRTVQAGTPFVAQQILTDTRYELWWREAEAHKFASFAILPLRTEDDVLGVLGVYSSDPYAFQEDEVGLLERLSGSLAFALISLRERAERALLQQQVIDAQKQALLELSTPVIPVAEGIIIMPLIGSIDTARARDITRALLSSISRYRAKVVILDVTGVPVIDSGVANHLTRSIDAVRLKGAQTIVTGISDAVAETIIDLGIDWREVKTLRDLQSGLAAAMERLAGRARTTKN